jgi:hypothetical protein
MGWKYIPLMLLSFKWPPPARLRALSIMIGETQQLVTNEPVEFEK